MQSPSLPPESHEFSGKLSPSVINGWSDSAHILDTDHFLHTLSLLERNRVPPELISSVITHFASKWLLELSEPAISTFNTSPENLSSLWRKKKQFIETLVPVLPRDDKSTIPCDFLLRLLRAANMVGVEYSCCAELEERISHQLDQASVTEIMIPAFSRDCATLFDVDLVLRLVRGFVSVEEGARSSATLVKVGKLIDCFLAEAAVDAHLGVPEFVALADALPNHAHLSDDGLYRAVDTYLKAHPSLPKQERKTLCNLIDIRKLSIEASLHAAQNQRLPVRTVVQVLLAQQTKLGKCVDWSGSQSGMRSPGFNFDLPTRCLSKREYAQQMEMKRLAEDVARLQSQCVAMERQIERVLRSKNKKKKGYFGWKKIRLSVFGIGEVGKRN